jgi:hypothetical protein
MQVMLEKLFKRLIKKEVTQPKYFFGRYSDNNKTVEKVKKWSEAEHLFREKKYRNCVDLFFDYLKDDFTQNVYLEKRIRQTSFIVYQGSIVIRGKYDDVSFSATVQFVKMHQQSNPAMRRLLEQNFFLYYSRFTLDGEIIGMRFDTDMETANPNKLYYGLKELAIKADQQDDILVNEFAQLQQIDVEHLEKLPLSEINIKLDYFRIFIRETLGEIEKLSPEKHEIAISNLLLSLGYRIDYLILPEGKLKQDLENVISIFYNKEDKSVAERNHLMLEAYKTLLLRTDDELIPYLYRTKSTFSIVAPQPFKAVVEHIQFALDNVKDYTEEKYNEMVQQMLEFGISFCQYSFSLPKPLTNFYQLFMEVNYPDYFMALGKRKPLFDKTVNIFNQKDIEKSIVKITNEWKEKYPKLLFKIQAIQYNSLANFNKSFLKEIMQLNFEGRK